jgi:hypothetical protein
VSGKDRVINGFATKPTEGCSTIRALEVDVQVAVSYAVAIVVANKRVRSFESNEYKKDNNNEF